MTVRERLHAEYSFWWTVWLFHFSPLFLFSNRKLAPNSSFIPKKTILHISVNDLPMHGSLYLMGTTFSGVCVCVCSLELASINSIVCQTQTQTPCQVEVKWQKLNNDTQFFIVLFKNLIISLLWKFDEINFLHELAWHLNRVSNIYLLHESEVMWHYFYVWRT